MIIENDGTVAFINSFAEKTLGWTFKEIKGKNFFTNFVPLDEQEDRKEAFEVALKNSDKGDDAKLIPLYKILSPQHLLKASFVNDSNSLNESFYKERKLEK